jgi:hypothetical protein
MRLACNLFAILVPAATAMAGTLTFDFSATFASTCPVGSPAICVTSLGLIHDGDTVSGSATWNDQTVGASIPNFATATVFSFTGPAGEGLSTPASQVTFVGANYSGNVFVDLQINIRSTVDNNFYIFFMNSMPNAGCGGATPVCAAIAENVPGTQGVFAKSYITRALFPTPEPSTVLSTTMGIGLVGILLVYRRRQAS